MTRRSLFRWFIAIVAVLALFISVRAVVVHDDARDPFSLTVLDVGQGDAILLTAPSGEHALIDAGPDARVLGPLARELGYFDRTIDLLVLTHPDLDHLGGMVSILERYQVGRVLMTGIAQDSVEYRRFQERVAELHIPVTIASRGRALTLGNDASAAHLTVLWPDRPLVGTRPDKPNNTSVVLKVVFGETSFLLTGDIEADTEAQLVGHGGDTLAASVLKIAHHGSDTSSTTAFLAAVQPDIALISVGQHNSFGHPSRRVLRRLERAGVRIYRTDEEGTIRVTSDGKTFQIRSLY